VIKMTGNVQHIKNKIKHMMKDRGIGWKKAKA